jgi:holo-[acyl-carrier protein] synthase
MISAIGVDLEQISRLKRAMENPRFLEKCFTESEQKYILSKANAAQSAAGIFCAKEAFIKALGVGIGFFSFCDIEVLHQENGKPYMKLYNRAKEMTEGANVLVSISHTGDLATAQVLIENGGVQL